MNFWDTLLNGAGDLAETAGDIVTSVGDNFESNAATNAALSDRLAIENQLAVTNNAKDQKRKDDNNELIRNITIVIVGLLVLVISFNLYVKYNREIK